MIAVTCCGAGAHNNAINENQNNGDTIWCVAPQNNDLTMVLENEGYTLVRGGNNKTLLMLAPEGKAVLLLGDGYRKPVQLTNYEMSLIVRKKLRVFADFSSIPGQNPETREATLERVVVIEKMGDLKPMDLLSVNRARFLATKSVNPMLVLARVAGFDNAIYGLDDTETFPLVDRPTEDLYVSTACLSEFSKLRLMPENNWKSFWEAMLSKLLNKEVSLSIWPSKVWPSYAENEQLPDSAKVHAVRKGVDWFWKAHFLIHPSWTEEYFPNYMYNDPPLGPALPSDTPDGDGSLGILEGHCSTIDANGSQYYRYCVRADVQGESAMALTLAGQLLGETRYIETAKKIINYSLEEFMAGPRNDPNSPSYGLISWMIHGRARDIYYGDDNARYLLGALLSASLMKENRWNKKLLAAINANFQTTGQEGFRGHNIQENDLQKNGREYYNSRHLFDPQPHFESWMWAVYLWLYSQTGDKQYLDLSEKGISLTMAAYPSDWLWTNGIQQERARMILPLAWLYRVSPTKEHKTWLNLIINDLKNNQVECGAIREELGDPSKGQFGGPSCNAEYGVNEAPLIAKNGDPVADMLYTSNFAVFGLNEAACATGDPKIQEMANRLADFLVRIQACSNDYSSVDGAWYRAFNYRDWNWWASNADMGWGSLGTLTGWTQSWIVATLALMQLGTSYWDLTKLVPSEEEGVHRFSTFNIRYCNPSNGDTGDKLWANRRTYVGRIVKDYNLDVVGMEEVVGNNQDSLTGKSQLQDLREMLPDYDDWAVEREGRQYEHNVIFYKKDKYALLGKGKFYLNAHPEFPGSGWSTGDDENLPRVLGWVHLQDKASGQDFFFAVTHTNYGATKSGKEACRLIGRRMRELAGDSPVVVVGDFNMRRKDHAEAWRGIASYLSDAALCTQTTCIPKGNITHTASNWLPATDSDCTGSEFDYLFFKRMIPLTRHIITEDYNRDIAPSDHFPLLVRFKFPAEDVQGLQMDDHGVFQVTTPQDLLGFSSLVNNGDASAEASLTQDMDMSQIKAMWQPIGTEGHPFLGSFDGQGHKLTGFNYTTATPYGGLIGFSRGAQICNFSIEGKLVCHHSTCGVIGYADYGNIHDVHSSLEIDATQSGIIHTGGVIGDAQDESTVSCCSFSGQLNVGIDNCDSFGGICGYTNTTRFDNCANYGHVSFLNHECYAGGIIGYVNNGSFPGVHNSLCVGRVRFTGSGSPMYSGAIIGRLVSYDTALMGDNYWLLSCAASASGENKSDKFHIVLSRQLRSGEICYALNASQSTPVWFQTIGEDNYPVLDATHGSVIMNEDGTYDNATGINMVNSTRRIVQSPVYDLLGRKKYSQTPTYTDLPKGLYIVKGKKMLITE